MDDLRLEKTTCRKISSKGSHGCRGGDRLSNLPDCLLHSILSNLKARQVVQTCALSRRWRNLWLELPCLDLTSEEFQIVRSANGSPQKAHGVEQEAEFGKFEDVVDNLMFHRSAAASSSQLDTLRLHIEDNLLQSTTYGRWIRRGLKAFSPAALDISCARPYITLPPLPSTGTHRLAKLRLDRVLLPSNFEELQFPVLEDLEIRNASINWLSGIASSSLKNLSIDGYRCVSVTSHTDVRRGLDVAFAVVAPRLASRHLGLQLCSRMDGPYRDIIVGKAPSLVQASIRLLNKAQLDVAPQTYSYLLTTICKLLKSLSNVSTLELSGFKQTMVARHGSLAPPPTEYPPQFQTYPYAMHPYPPHFQTYPYAMHPFHLAMASVVYVPGSMLQAILDDENHGLPMFRNLTTMTFDECEIGDNMEMLCRFLHNAPSIEKLIMQHCMFLETPERNKLQDKPKWTSYLRLVEVQYKENDYYDLLRGRGVPSPVGLATPQPNGIVSLLKEILPATTMIRYTKTN